MQLKASCRSHFRKADLGCFPALPADNLFIIGPSPANDTKTATSRAEVLMTIVDLTFRVSFFTTSPSGNVHNKLPAASSDMARIGESSPPHRSPPSAPTPLTPPPCTSRRVVRDPNIRLRVCPSR